LKRRGAGNWETDLEESGREEVPKKTPPYENLGEKNPLRVGLRQTCTVADGYEEHIKGAKARRNQERK